MIAFISLYDHHFWLVVSTPPKNMIVSWDDELPNLWENKSHVPKHQADYDWFHITIF